MSFLKVKGISLYYEMHGEGEPIVFVAGFGADHTNFGEVVKYFKDSYQVILLDNRGAGQSDVPAGPYTIAEMADDVYALCCALKIEKAHFVGNSMGGFILQTLAVRHPALIKSLVLGNTAMRSHAPFTVYLEAQFELLKAKAPLVSLIKASCSWLFSEKFIFLPGKLSELIKVSLANPHPFTEMGYAGQYAALCAFDAREWAKQITCPTLVLGSDEDLIFNEKVTKQLVKEIPHAEYACFTECGHLPQIEDPEKFSDVVKNFFI